MCCSRQCKHFFDHHFPAKLLSWQQRSNDQSSENLTFPKMFERPFFQQPICAVRFPQISTNALKTQIPLWRLIPLNFLPHVVCGIPEAHLELCFSDHYSWGIFFCGFIFAGAQQSLFLFLNLRNHNWHMLLPIQYLCVLKEQQKDKNKKKKKKQQQQLISFLLFISFSLLS